MANSPRKVVAELTKVWDSVVAKGKISAEVGTGGNIKKIINNVPAESMKKWIQGSSTGSLKSWMSVQNPAESLKKWMKSVPATASLQNVINKQKEILSQLPKDVDKLLKLPSADNAVQQTRVKVGELMTGYEDFIGIKEVRQAHARVLSAEAKFIECQEQRRMASNDLMEVQSNLMEIRAELDRTQRGEEAYVELIKKEFAVYKDERAQRSKFDDFERMEREIFAELSSALRFSHEKEKAQNEKTKYWSIVGSIIGAALGIIGTTINNRMKQSHLKQILGETSFQVASIQSSVESLTSKMNEGTLTTSEVSRMFTDMKKQEVELALQRKKLSNSMHELVKVLQKISTGMTAFHNEKFPVGATTAEAALEPEIALVPAPYSGLSLQAIAVCIIGVLAYKFL